MENVIDEIFAVAEQVRVFGVPGAWNQSSELDNLGARQAGAAQCLPWFEQAGADQHA